jgi:peptide/nickel transport system permease protein
LSLSSLFLILLFTFPLGLLSGYKKDSFFDRAVTFLSFLGMSLPAFWLGLMLILLFSLNLSLFPTSGYLDPLLSDASLWVKATNILHHMVLPLVTILIGGLAGLIRFNRFSIIEILSQDYIQAGRARGLSERRLLFKHAFKNAALPIVTILGAGLSGLIGGSFVIEFIFSWPGMGQLGVASVFSRDYPVLMGSILFSSVLIMLGNFLADISYSKIDPRVKIR